jgi:Na+-transporting methylmalonyl-CoA/oxaloacetate decarboxylase gamma subunit
MIPEWIMSLTHTVLVVGMGLSFVLLILVVYAQIRMVQVEHEGFHALEKEEHEAQARGPEGETHANTRWDAIVALAGSPLESDWRRAILEADIMLSDALNERGFAGPTVGDQLKQANPIQMTTLDIAWRAHKMRNQVAHEGESLALNEREVRGTIDEYKRVFEELGAI